MCTTKIQKILQISDESGECITNELLPFIGPNYDFHKNNYTPIQLGYNEITIELGDGGSFSFKGDEIININ